SYIAWNGQDLTPSKFLNDGTQTTNYAIGFQPYLVKIVASNDGGDSFSGHAYINTGTGFAPDPTFTGPAAEHYNFVRQALPQLTVSQGTPAGRATSGNSGGITGAYGGQLSVAYDQWSYTPQGTDPLRIADNIRFARELDLNPNPNLRVSDGAAAVS